MSPRYLAVLVALGAVWGSSFLFIKVVVDETSPMELATGRIVFGAAALAPIVWIRGFHLKGGPRVLRDLLVLAVCASAVPFVLISWAETHIDSGVASVLNSTMPLWTAVFASAFLADEQLAPVTVMGLLAGFGGVAVLSGGDLTGLQRDSLLGDLAVVGAAACYGVGAVFARARLQIEDRVTISVVQLVLAGLVLVPALLAADGAPTLDLSTKAWLAWITLGVVNTGLANVVYYWLIKHVGSIRTSLVTYIIPTVGLLLGAVVLDERLGISALFGAGLIVVGVAMVAGGSRLGLARTDLVPAHRSVAGDGVQPPTEAGP
jgi:drug/metabolite transporter (DMT)-like permease